MYSTYSGLLGCVLLLVAAVWCRSLYLPLKRRKGKKKEKKNEEERVIFSGIALFVLKNMETKKEMKRRLRG